MASSQIIDVAGFVDDSITDGPGLRFTLFTQGCPHHCEGCHNPDIYHFGIFTPYTAEAVFERIRRNPLVRGIVRLTSGHEAKSLLDFVPEMEVMVEGHKKGEDFILRGAQCLIVAHVERNIHLPEANAMLALHNASLLAQAMGLGSFLVGYLVGACGRDRSIPDFLGVPKTHRVHGALALGYPKQMFSRWPKRKPPEVTWR